MANTFVCSPRPGESKSDGGSALKVLVISWFFPPTNTMGALRVGKFAGYLHKRQHDVRVLSARGIPRPQTLAQAFPDDRVTRTFWADVNYPPKLAAQVRNAAFADGGRKSGAAAGGAGDSGPGLSPGGPGKPGLLSALAGLYVNLTNFPDASIGWFPFAYAHGRRLVKRHRPDLIFASGPPFTVLLLGHALARHGRIPWVAEFRDRWTDDPYDPYYATTRWRMGLERRLERFLIASADGLVTVSEPWAETYRQTHAKPTIAVYNGYDPADFCEGGLGAAGDPRLRIVYTGRIFPERRDPSPLFAAVARLPQPERIEIAFYGDDEEKILPLARPYGVEALIEVHPHVPYEQALLAQSRADVLFFMQWNDAREQGNVPGKLFEYLASRRPILANGLEDGVPAAIIRDRSAGFFSNDPQAIADQLSAWLNEKEARGAIACLPESARAGLTRDDQHRNLEVFLQNLARRLDSPGEVP